jgi:dGTPase
MEENYLETLVEFRDNKMPQYSQKGSIKDRKKFKEESDKCSECSELFIRNEFSRDSDRIKFSRAFRRLEHKAQIYSHEKGDHFRTRLTHTLEVAQIARSLARNLNLNEDLVEAITLGHDIGHTPFGHQGERTLDKIMSGKDDLSGKLKYKIDYGGFKHNFHSLKILDQLEVKYINIKGMNLTWQVLEGILKHTKIKRDKECIGCGGCWDINRFLSKPDFYQKFMMYPHSVTLEGQIVAIADEIAQRQHDVDDGLRDSELLLNFQNVSQYLVKKFEEVILDGMDSDELRLLTRSIKSLSEEKNIEREELYKTNTLVRNIIDFFIKDVTINSLKEISENIDQSIKEENGIKMYTNKFIDFSKTGKKVNDIIEGYIKVKILNSYNVNRFDGKAIYIIRQLFKAYYTNPKQMPEYILQRLSSRIKDISNEIYNIKFKDGLEIQGINFVNNKPEIVNKLIQLMKLEINLDELKLPDEELKKGENIDEKGLIKEEVLIKINKKENIDDIEIIIKAMLEIHYAFLSVICDYIAGMTDNYASAEFENLYLVK